MPNGTGTTIKIRKNALNMATWDPVLLWYAKAVAVMRKLPLTDSTSWIYQAAIHGFEPANPYWKLWAKNQTLPGQNEQGTFWRQCQHGSWFFLPWHRMYLGYFEKIVRKIIIGLGGPADWALPYWNYNEGKPSRKLPDAFTESHLPPPDGSANPLLELSRDSGNDSQPFLDERRISLKPAFQEHQFAGGTHVGSQGFGGPITVFHHSGGSHGALEGQPHDQVHDMVGGVMGDPVTAGYDPIFWLHHANIDRLWEVWLKADPINQNPAPSSNWQKFAFKFNDGLGNTPTLTPHDVLDSKMAPFYYQYDDVSQPAGAMPPPVPMVAVGAVRPIIEGHMPEEPIPEMVGASSEATPLATEAKTLNVRLFPLSGPLRKLGAAEGHFRKAYLHVENIRGKGRPASYDVYLNVPEGAQQPAEQFYVGNIPMFGLEQASVATERHPGNGLRFTFNVTETVNFLKAENQWNPEVLRVTFVPTRKPKEGAHLEVGRVSLYYT